MIAQQLSYNVQFVDKSIERDQAAAEKGDDEKDVVDEEEEELGKMIR